MVVRYPPSALAPDALRAGAGLVFAVAPMLVMDLMPAAYGVLGVLAGLFALFAVQVLRRWRTRLEYDEIGLRVLPNGAGVRWADIDKLTLRWFSLRREAIGRGFVSLGRSRRASAVEMKPEVAGPVDWRRQGWFELEVRSGTGVIRLDSRLEHFEHIVRLAHTGSADRLLLDAATEANLALALNGFEAGASTQELLAS